MVRGPHNGVGFVALKSQEVNNGPLYEKAQIGKSERQPGLMWGKRGRRLRRKAQG